MSVTITLGKAGRLVVPKTIRDSLGLREGSRLKLEVHGGKLQATPEPDPVSIELKDGFPVIQSAPHLKRRNIVQAIKADRVTCDERQSLLITPSPQRRRGAVGLLKHLENQTVAFPKVERHTMTFK